MKASLALWLSLPVLVCACSSDDPPGLGTAGTGGAGGAGGNAAGAAGTAGAAGRGASGGGNGGASGASMSGAGGAMPGGSSGGAGAPGSDAGTDAGDSGGGDVLDDDTMTFFVTSDGIGNGGNLGGLAGADAFCRQLAIAASPDLARRTWRAYLSTATVNAGERIGTGPWRNQAGEIVANNLTQLHDQAEDGTLNDTWPINDLTIPLDEQGNQVANNVHDILTGTQADGTLDAGFTCDDWTSNSADDDVRVGHSNRNGGGQDPSWTTTHAVGCNQEGAGNITQGGGRGSLYCFAVITEP